MVLNLRIRKSNFIKPVYSLFRFELKLQWKKFLSIMIMTTVIVILPIVFTYILNPYGGLPAAQENFLSGSLMLMLYVITISAGLLFSGIICDEYRKKTGLTLLPLISKGKILIAKYLTNLLLLLISVTYYFFLILLFDYYFYAEWIVPTFFRSYGFTLLFSMALASLICFLSSFLPSSTAVLLIEILLVTFGFDLIASLFSSINYQIEPVFSLTFLFKIINTCIFFTFPNMERYHDIPDGGNITRIWFFPEIHTAIIGFIAYSIICLIFAYLIFRRKQL